MQPLHSLRSTSPATRIVLLGVLAASLSAASCNKEELEPCGAVTRIACPVPTELPPATCEGAHTFGALVDTMLFVANYAPNNNGIG